MTSTYDELRELILSRFDPDDLVDILNISSEEILDRFEDRVQENRDKFDWLDEEPNYGNQETDYD